MNNKSVISKKIVQSIISEIKNLSEATTDDEIKKKLDQNRSKWKGCGDPSPFVNLYEFGALSTTPEFGYAEFDGVIDGKNIKVKACFDSYKLIRTMESETGDRGTFKGEYYSESTPLSTPRTFKGDNSKANKFQYGTLTDSKDYNFFTNNWKYAGEFIDGKIGGKGTIIFLDSKEIYKGEFKNGMIDGVGTYKSLSTGKEIKGTFKQNDIVIGVTLSDGTVIKNIFDSEISVNPVKNDSLTINVRKSANLKGVTNFKSTIVYKENPEDRKSNNLSRTFEGTLPNVSVKLVRKDNKDDVKIGKSDKNGDFLIGDINYGVYVLTATLSHGDSRYFFLKIDELDIDEDNEIVNLILSPNKQLKKSETETVEFNKSDLSKKSFNTDWYRNMFVPSDNMGEYKDKSTPKTLEEDCLQKLSEYGEDLKVMHQTGKFPTNLSLLDTEKEINFSDLKNNEQLKSVKNQLQFCWNKYKDAKGFRRKIGEKNILLMRNPVGQFLDFQLILPEHYNKEDIYNKKVMELSKTISKVVLEHKQRKQDSSNESKIIRNRLSFIVENSHSKTIKKSLIEEKSKLINFGYNKTIVNEEFHEIMTRL